MKRLKEENTFASPEGCADAVLEAIPQVMTTVRGIFRQRRPAELTVPQFRALGFIAYHRGNSMTAVAEHIGLSISSASKLVAALVERGFVRHMVSREDRRLAKLAVTSAGKAALDDARQALHATLTTAFTRLTDEERAAVLVAMRGLQRTLLNPTDCAQAEVCAAEEQE